MAKKRVAKKATKKKVSVKDLKPAKTAAVKGGRSMKYIK